MVSYVSPLKRNNGRSARRAAILQAGPVIFALVGVSGLQARQYLVVTSISPVFRCEAKDHSAATILQLEPS